MKEITTVYLPVEMEAHFLHPNINIEMDNRQFTRATTIMDLVL
jgi:hypothetical protein